MTKINTPVKAFKINDQSTKLKSPLFVAPSDDPSSHVMNNIDKKIA